MKTSRRKLRKSTEANNSMFYIVNKNNITRRPPINHPVYAFILLHLHSVSPSLFLIRTLALFPTLFSNIMHVNVELYMVVWPVATHTHHTKCSQKNIRLIHFRITVTRNEIHRNIKGAIERAIPA